MKDDRMSALFLPDGVSPEDLHKVAGPRGREFGEVASEPELVKETRGARAVGIPASPDAFDHREACPCRQGAGGGQAQTMFLAKGRSRRSFAKLGAS